ncbi:hypothetical protein ATANTOWER_025334 [Ataeniobius toweri]|uniref:Uncharacterized protein n=1 Tax=Ataeniobius toweri TaxID=208326 RepID=A0ABU7B2S3_9TELE|nr:hypothetical protein [Ataeniobius toweri]
MAGRNTLLKERQKKSHIAKKLLRDKSNVMGLGLNKTFLACVQKTMPEKQCTSALGGCGSGGRSSSCNQWVASLKPHSVVVSLGKTLQLTCLPMVFRGLGGACVLQHHFCQCGPGQLWLQCSLPLSECEWVDDHCSVKLFGVSGDLIKRYTSVGHLSVLPLHHPHIETCCGSILLWIFLSSADRGKLVQIDRKLD